MIRIDYGEPDAEKYNVIRTELSLGVLSHVMNEIIVMQSPGLDEDLENLVGLYARFITPLTLDNTHEPTLYGGDVLVKAAASKDLPEKLLEYVKKHSIELDLHFHFWEGPNDQIRREMAVLKNNPNIRVTIWSPFAEMWENGN